ncbi:hypothetical protein GCM10010388_73070 [Streptomyces mauvecolor]
MFLRCPRAEPQGARPPPAVVRPAPYYACYVIVRLGRVGWTGPQGPYWPGVFEEFGGFGDGFVDWDAVALP